MFHRFTKPAALRIVPEVTTRGFLMNGRTTSIAANDGGNFDAYLTLPKRTQAPGVLIIQEIFGVNDHIREVVDEYADAGYLALAPDMFWRIEPNVQLGYSAEEVQKARAYRPKFNLDLGVRDIEAAIRAIRAMPECDGKLAVVGYCFGGLMAYLTAARTDVLAASCYYGGGIDGFLGEAPAVKCPIQFHFGSQDAAIPAEAWDKVRGAFAGRPEAEIFVYEGAQHGFNCTRRASFDREASKLARARTLGLLRKTIGPHA
jgi:carboxymethylenebutenolidase